MVNARSWWWLSLAAMVVAGQKQERPQGKYRAAPGVLSWGKNLLNTGAGVPRAPGRHSRLVLVRFLGEDTDLLDVAFLEGERERTFAVLLGEL